MYFIKKLDLKHCEIQRDLGNGQSQTVAYVALPVIPQADKDIHTLRSFRKSGAELFEEDNKLLSDFEKQSVKAVYMRKLGEAFLKDILDILNGDVPEAILDDIREEVPPELDFYYNIKTANHNHAASLTNYCVTENEMTFTEKMREDFIALTIRSPHLHPAAIVEIVDIYFDSRAIDINELGAVHLVQGVQSKRWQAAREQTALLLNDLGHSNF